LDARPGIIELYKQRKRNGRKISQQQIIIIIIIEKEIEREKCNVN
jgi:hypothetical protein